MLEVKDKRSEELREKVRLLGPRFQEVMGRKLELEDLEDFLEYCKRKEVRDFIESRLGLVFTPDVKRFQAILGEIKGVEVKKVEVEKDGRGAGRGRVSGGKPGVAEEGKSEE